MRRRSWTAVIIGGTVIAAAAGGVAGWRLSQHAALPRASCGSAVTHRLDEGTRALSADPGALACFSAAARDCRAAGIEITETGTGTGTSFVFSTGPGPRCQATELSQAYSANFGGSAGPVTPVPCRLAAVSGAGVTLGCGGHDVLIPSAVSPR